MSVLTREVASRMRRLASTLSTLRLRVREAVASETSRAVGDAVRELLTAALDGRHTQPRYRQARNWDDDPDPWRDEDDVRRVVTTPARRDDLDETERSPTRARRWSAVLAFAATVMRCWASRRVPAWVALVLGSLAGFAAWAGNHLSRAGLDLLATVGDLFPPLEPTSWDHDFY